MERTMIYQCPEHEQEVKLTAIYERTLSGKLMKTRTLCPLTESGYRCNHSCNLFNLFPLQAEQ